MNFVLPQHPLLIIFFLLYACITGYRQKVRILGEPILWHKITLELDGPKRKESVAQNPFMDCKMEVPFTHPQSKSQSDVPGFFATDGDAANSGARSGNKWHCYLRQNRADIWQYTISFFKGNNVAIQPATKQDTAMNPYDGVSGTFEVAETNLRSTTDLRAKGGLQYVNKHHLQFQGDGSYFLRFGPAPPITSLNTMVLITLCLPSI
jgi:hypothetical protein